MAKSGSTKQIPSSFKKYNLITNSTQNTSVLSDYFIKRFHSLRTYVADIDYALQLLQNWFKHGFSDTTIFQLWELKESINSMNN